MKRCKYINLPTLFQPLRLKISPEKSTLDLFKKFNYVISSIFFLL